MAALFFVQSIVPTRVYALEPTAAVVAESGTEPVGSEPAASAEPDTGESQARESDPTAAAVPETTEAAVPETTAATVPETTEAAVPETTAATVPETTEAAVPETTEETVPETTAATVPETTEATVPETTAETVPEEEKPPVYEVGTILLYTYAQLLKVGSGEPVTDGDADADTLGTGAPVLREDGGEVTYGLDGRYSLAQDIPLPALWQLPQGFTGRIAPMEDGGERPLYDALSNTIYLYNPYQLEAVPGGTQSVMTGDVSAERFGTGEKLYPNGEAAGPLTYSLEHTYVLSARFCSDRPEIQVETPAVWQEGVINLYCYEQLLLVGTGVPVTDGDDKPETLGKGQPVLDETGVEVTYAPDGVYRLAADIQLPKEFDWRIPEDFYGSFLDGEGADETAKLYDPETDTLYLYNLSQLAVVGGTMRACSRDMLALGEGEPVTLEDGTTVTYSRERNYVLSAAFRWAAPVAMLAEPGPLDPEGRDYAGQLSVTLADEDYTLIGDRQQLQALDAYSVSSSKAKTPVTGPIWKMTYARERLGDMTLIRAELVYPGDADLVDGLSVKTYTYGSYTTNADGDVTGIETHAAEITSETKNFADMPLYGVTGYLEIEEVEKADSLWTPSGSLIKTTEGKLGEKYCRHKHVSVTQIGETYVGGTLDAPDETITSYSGDGYDTGGNYIIFRDIDLRSETWYPLMFNGKLYGAKASGTSTLWDEGKTQLNVNTGDPAVITNIAVTPMLAGDKYLR